VRPAGTFRFTRFGDLLSGYYSGPTGGWARLDVTRTTRDPLHVNLSLWRDNRASGAKDVAVGFDNFRATSGRILCP
jgi:hypothetical protein